MENLKKEAFNEKKEYNKFLLYCDAERIVKETNMSDGIYFLAELLYIHHSQPLYILIDEYDGLVNDYIG